MTLTQFAEEPNQEQRIAKLREEIKKLGGNTMSLEEMPADLEEEFLRHVLEYEMAEPISLFRLLENSGQVLPPPDDLNDDTITTKVSEIVSAMASMGSYLLHTNHLSDRALYEYLYNDGLREEAVLFPENPSYAYMIDLTGSGSEEDNQIYLKYYADEEHRKQWSRDWPDDTVPEHEEPPFDRDRHLPQSPVG
ncbi:MAG TPA: hypothetical protein VGQ39_04710 [Pyrinomonadaceae bacterium]|jgi:hypothetical protein|nr:hypothetical protein [Pyrinomonadaceae bacterium]